MRANVLTNWKTLEMQELPVPEPKPGQILIEVIYAGICGSDVTVHNHNHPTATVPRTMCHEVLGIVRKINADGPLPYAEGSRVVVFPLSYCGVCDACRDGNFHVCRDLHIMGLHMEGGFAEYVCADAEKAFPVGADIPDEVAILTEPLAVGFHANARAGTEPGDTVLVIGGGPIGILCGICARCYGAGRVVLSELNPERIALAEQFGLEVVDAGRPDAVEELLRRSGGEGFDKVFEASGSQAGSTLVANVCRIRGTVVPVGIPAEPRAYETAKLILKEISIVGSRVHTLKHFGRTLQMLERLHQTGEVDFRRMIACTLPLEELARGIAMQQAGENHGKILIKMKGGNA